MSNGLPLILKAQRLVPSYQPEPDRIRLDMDDAKGQCLSLWLTRRLAVRLLPVLTGNLKSTHGLAARLPESLRDHAVAMEHIAVITKPRREPNQELALKVSGGSPVLVSAIELKQRGNSLELHFLGVDNVELAILLASRSVLHQLVGALVRHMRRARWTEAISLDWLDETVSPTSHQLPTGSFLN